MRPFGNRERIEKMPGADTLAVVFRRPFLMTICLAAAFVPAADGAESTPPDSKSSSNASPRYALADGPFKIENLGSIVSANTQERQVLFRLGSTGERHLLLYYVADYGTYPLQILDVNLGKATTRLTNAALGRPGARGTVLRDDTIYLGTSDANGKGYFVQYNPTTGNVRPIAELSGKGAQFCENGADGWTYIGEITRGEVDRYNPATDRFERLGRMDTNYTGVLQYADSLGADGRYVYVGLGQLPWYLAVYDTQTGRKTLYWKEAGDTAGTVYRGKSGGWYYRRQGPATKNAGVWYQLKSGVPTQIASPPALYPDFERGGVVDDACSHTSSTGLEVNLDGAYPTDTDNRAVVKWREAGAKDWKSAGASRFHVMPVNIRRLYSWGSTNLFGFADFYGPAFLYDPGLRAITVLGRPQFSLYDALFEHGMVFLSGYPAVTLCYDPAKPWSLAGSTGNKSSEDVNPHQVAAFHKYHYYSALGADGFVYVGVHHERNSTGGELGWYDPRTGTKGSLREPFLNDDVRDLKPALGGTKLVYASNTGKLFVFDVARKRIERTITPIPGMEALDKVTEVAPGILFGAVSNRIYEVDIRTGEVLWLRTLPGEAFGADIRIYDHRLVLGPDAYVWMFIGNALFRINPAEGSLQKIVDMPGGNPVFHNGDLYVYRGPNLFRISGVLQAM
jgi:hypothetical protein